MNSEALHLEDSSTSAVMGTMEGAGHKRSSCAQQTCQYGREENRNVALNQESHRNCDL